jgi:hypothetical protein
MTVETEDVSSSANKNEATSQYRYCNNSAHINICNSVSKFGVGVTEYR